MIISVLLLLDRLQQQQLSQSDGPLFAHGADAQHHTRVVSLTHYERLTETITVTATVAAPSSTAARWYHPESDTNPPQAESHAGAPSASTAPSRATRSSMPTLTPTPVVADSDGDSDGLLQFLYEWHLHFEMPKLEFPQFDPLDTANKTLHAVLDSIGTVYRFCAKVMTYPN